MSKLIRFLINYGWSRERVSSALGISVEFIDAMLASKA
jgi:hypothetical protein